MAMAERRPAAKPAARRAAAARCRPPRPRWPLLLALGASASVAQGRSDGVPLDRTGFAEVSAARSQPQMAAFVTRVLLHLGAEPGEADAVYVRNFSGMFAGAPESAFDTMLGFLLQRPTWAHFDPTARCIADRSSPRETIEKVAGNLCGSKGVADLNCSQVPQACNTDPYLFADWVFGSYYRSLTGPNPLTDCYFDGSAMYAGAKLYSANTSTECLVASTGSQAAAASDWSSGATTGVAVLGIAESPGLVAAQTSGHGLPGDWWIWLAFAAVLLICIGYGGYQSKKHLSEKAKRAEMRKRDWFKSKLSRRSRDVKQSNKRAAEVAEEAPPATAPPAMMTEVPAAPLLSFAPVAGQARAPNLMAMPQQGLPAPGIMTVPAEPLAQYGHYAPLWRADR